MSEKWTKGPWVFAAPIGAEHAEVRDKDGRRIAVTIGSYPMRTRTEGANAHLISAAPELYAALERLYGRLLMSDRDGECRITAEEGEMAEFALKKARGEL